jgi:cell division septation protein DedD
MAETQAKADSVVAQLRAKGYKVRTSSTNKGVRVLVGPEKDSAAATATKHKIEQDDSLNLKGAWVSNWQPPTS